MGVISLCVTRYTVGSVFCPVVSSLIFSELLSETRWTRLYFVWFYPFNLSPLSFPSSTPNDHPVLTRAGSMASRPRSKWPQHHPRLVHPVTQPRAGRVQAVSRHTGSSATAATAVRTPSMNATHGQSGTPAQLDCTTCGSGITHRVEGPGLPSHCHSVGNDSDWATVPLITSMFPSQGTTPAGPPLPPLTLPILTTNWSPAYQAGLHLLASVHANRDSTPVWTGSLYAGQCYPSCCKAHG